MKNVTYKYSIDDRIKFKEKFSPTASLALKGLAGHAARVVERRDYDGPCYRLAGIEGFFQERCFEDRVSNPYIIFVGESRDTLQPVKSAPNEEFAVEIAKQLQGQYPCVEATLMPEEDLDINEIVYSYYKED